MERTVTILNEEGMHARPAGVFAKKAAEFKSQIQVKAGEIAKNAKSIMSIMSLGLKKGSQLTIQAEGEDAEAAVETLATLVENKFEIK